MGKKLLTTTLLTTLVILFGLTWYCSLKAEEYFTVWVEKSNRLAPALLQAETIDYRRQFFTADAITAVEFGGTKRVEFQHLIRHHVWGVNITTTPLPATASQEMELDGLRIVTDIGPTGAITSRLTLPRLAIGPAAERFAIDGMAGEWRLNAEATEGSWNFTFAGGEMKFEDLTFATFAGAHLSGRMTNLHELPLGSSRTTIDSFTLGLDGVSSVSIEGVKLYGENRFDAEQHYRSSSELSFSSLSSGSGQFSHGQLVFELADVDRSFIDFFLHSRDRLRQEMKSTDFDFAHLEQRFLSPLYTELLKSGLTLSLKDLSLATEGGSLHGHGNLTLLPSHDQDILKPLGQIQANLDIGFDIRILNRLYRLFDPQRDRKNMAQQEEQLRMITGALTQLGFLSHQENDRFRLIFSLDRGQVTLNDKPFQRF